MDLDKEFTHFAGKDAVGHVAEAQAQGVLSKAESHAIEIPGHFSALSDSARDTAILLALLWEILLLLNISFWESFLILIITSISWLIWKAGRSAWLGWARLERLHTVIKEEKWEIEHHRKQEREELGALYRAKGFQGKLLEDVLDVLMADGDRLLKVMIEEELGLRLENTEHPLKQALGAAIGCLLASVLSIGSLFLSPSYGIWVTAFAIVGFAALLAAKYEKNDPVPALIWNIAIAALPLASIHFLGSFFFKGISNS